MKVLFIGEGRHDIGDPSHNPYDPRPARGTIPTLARRVGSVDADSVALAWTEISRFNPSARKPGYPAKIAATALLAERKFGCAATVVVADRDGDVGRQAALVEGADRARQLFPRHVTVWGLTVESVEAWTLGVPGRPSTPFQHPDLLDAGSLTPPPALRYNAFAVGVPPGVGDEVPNPASRTRRARLSPRAAWRSAAGRAGSRSRRAP